MLASMGVVSAVNEKTAIAEEEADGIMSLQEFSAKEIEFDPDVDEEDLKDRYVYYLHAEKSRKQGVATGDDVANNVDGDVDGDDGDDDAPVGEDDEPTPLSESQTGRIVMSKKLADGERAKRGLKWVGPKAGGGGFVYQKVCVTPLEASPSKASPRKSVAAKSVTASAAKDQDVATGKGKPIAAAKGKPVAGVKLVTKAQVAKPASENRLINPRKKRTVDDAPSSLRKSAKIDDKSDDADAESVRAQVAKKLNDLPDTLLHAMLAEQDDGVDMTGAPRKRVVAAVTSYLTRADA